MAVTRPISVPLIADEKSLAQALHKRKGTCYHAYDVAECELTAKAVMDSGVVMRADEFVREMKDMPEVQAIIKDALSEAWKEGADAFNWSKNPYED